MNALLGVLLTLIAAAGWVTVTTREPVRQAIVAGLLGLLLALVFFALQAPDVAFSELVIGTAAVPAMLLLAIAKIREQQARQQEASGDQRAEGERPAEGRERG